MLLTMAVVISLLSATAYACNPAAENCTITATINHTSENSSHADKEETAVSLFAGGCGTESDPYQITTAEQLNRVRCFPDKHFILTADIDLSGYENWEPIGTFKPLSDDPKDEETPDPEAAFTGTFNGNGYTISNLTINQPAGTAVGLFGCAVGDEKNPSSISNLTVENADVTGYAFVGGMLGVQYLNGNLEGLSLTGDQNTVRGNTNVGGITGGSLSDMKDCNAAADIVLRGDGANHAGVLSGGLEDGSLLNCTATGGTVTVKGNNRYGVGGLAGCVIEGATVTNCHADDVSIIACGKNNAMIGGLLGHTGASDAEIPTQVTGCSADVTIIVSDGTSRVGGLVGSGFYLEQYREYYPTPTMYRLVNCSTSGSITGGSESIGSITGYAYNSPVENCTSTMTINCASENVPQVGKEETGVVPPTTGILVVAHGSPEDEWNQPVRDAVEGIDCPYPVELGFLEFVEGEDIGTAVASLEEQGVEHIITVPIFVASASGHIEEIKYILGIPSSITEEEAIEEGLEVVSHNAEIEMTSALDDHPLVAEILDDRIATVSQQADQEIVVLVAHGTSDAEDLAVWKNNLESLGQQLKENYQFLDVDYGFVAMGEPNARAVVEAQQAENPGASVIVMPVMLSEGTFTGTTIPEVLTGLTYVYPEEGQRSLLPHDKISQLIVARAYDSIGVFAGGNGTTESPYQIATAEQLDQVRNYLDKDFVLTADIDLSGYENWEPIGTFQPLSDDPEDEETPDPELAFTGTFNGNGYTISNLTIDQPEGMSVGLFGCVAGKQEGPIHIYDLTLENVDVTGNFCVGGVVGFQYADSILENITLTGDNRVQGNIYVGGILGGSDIGGGSAELKNCNAAANIVLLGDAANSAGVLGGALNACSVIDCTATGTVTAEGEDYFALGGLIGGAFEGIEVINCHADDVSITACGKNNTMIGGLLGYAGTYGKQLPTQVTECSANVTIAVLNSTERVGGLVGGSFYHELAAEARPVPARYAINSCNTSGSITGGGNEVGSIAGYAYDSTVENCTSTMTWNDGVLEQIGYAVNEEQTDDIGILVVAHGSDENWNQRVRESVAEVEVPYPVELGFLDAETENIAMAVQALEEKGVKRIVAVPIFVCSASSHMEEIKYMLGLPSSLDDAAAQEEGLERIEKTATVELTSALDDHLLIAEILDERLKNLSQDAENEIVVLVAHGTSNPENLAVWKEKMASLGDKLQQIQGFKQVHYGFVGAGTPNIRTVVEEVKKNNPDCTVIVMPVMLSEGVYTDSKIPTSLEGITYLYPEAGQRALLPHANVAQYIAFRANDAIIGDIKMQESGQTHVIQYSDVALEEGGKVCVCGSFAYRAMQEALGVLSPGAVAERSRFTAVGPSSEGTEAALQTILGTAGYRLEERLHNGDYYSYQITDHESGRTLTVKARPEVFPENFYALKNKVKNNTASSEEKKTFQALRAQVVEKLRWEDADNLLIIGESTVFEGGSGMESDPYRISTAGQLDRVRNYLDKDFVLTANIDLSGYENWEPIGIFQPLSDDPEDEETPDPELAFTGNFNGNGYTISNLTIDQPEGMSVGLFGCAVGDGENPSSIYDLKVENVNVTGNFLVGGVIGFQALDCVLENVTLTGINTVQGYQATGGITGGTFGDLIGCDAVADIVVLGDGCCAGVILGGQEGNSAVRDCMATGTITAEGDNCFGLGGLAGNAGYAREGAEVTNCHADVSIMVLGENNTLVGGLLGFTGTFGDDAPAEIKGCSANVNITVVNSTELIGGLVGGSFYHEFYADERPVPSSYAIADSTTSGSITGGSSTVGSIAGYAYDSTIENCTSTLAINGASDAPQIGKEETGGESGGESGGEFSTIGILIVAPGSPEDEWNQPIRDAVEAIDCPYPVELGFLEFVEGEDIWTAVASMEEQGVERIITVPIFVTYVSGHIEEIK
ncbi:N-acetylmuramoyl-L-alanine amidase [Methanosarcina siciliae HI350]|uniref:N-acetylmuramoyl-L-alanine amidase n=1 Tax=Methanosarcina siciliae HI350 TaxID=1434119 RepID=A0A0E3LB96_9EURY|nr:CbiX/SirB N-terminal domain-containing protein [Methanosarcina siciliae]AKB33386.1 N-acetylmuramoyl-L-alanine amidase [Methanosarcina siciliae HI350]